MLKKYEIKYTCEVINDHNEKSIVEKMTSVYSTCFTKAYDDFVKYSEIFNEQIPCNEKIIVNENIRLRLVGEYELEKDSSLHFIPKENLKDFI